MTEAEMRAMMIGAMRELLGEGYVDDYYEQMASDFVGVALAYKDPAQQHRLIT